MKHVISIQSLFILIWCLTTGCQRQNLSATPEPEELITNPIYQEQIREIDRQRMSQGRPTATELIERQRLSKNPPQNITSQEEYEEADKIVVELPNNDVSIEENDKRVEEGEEYPEPVHEGQRVEEYFVLPEIKDESGDSEPSESEHSVTDDVDTETVVEEEADSTGMTDTRPVARPEPEEAVEEAGPEDVQEEEQISNEDDLVEESTEEPSSEEVFAPEKSLRPKARPDSIVERAEEAESFQARWDNYRVGPQYTIHTLKALEDYGDILLDPSSDLTSDNGFCPNYNDLTYEERKRMWLFLISALVEKESGFDTGAQYQESNGKYSRGLLQFGYASTKAYGCGFTSEMELETNPRKNLECGVKVMSYWIERDRIMRYYNYEESKGFGLARYWGALRFEYWERRNRTSYNRVIQIQRRVRALPFCERSYAPEKSLRPKSRPVTSEVS